MACCSCSGSMHLPRLALTASLSTSRQQVAMRAKTLCAPPYVMDTAALTEDAKALIQRIKDAKMHAGVSIKPNTPVSAIEDIVPMLDFVLVMTVEPGFGGQAFMPECTEKVCCLFLPVCAWS